MAKRAFDKIMAGLNEALEIAEGRADPSTYRLHHVPTDVDVRAVRNHLGLSQAEFSTRFGLPIGNIRDWEQGRSKPDQAARMLILTIRHQPDAVSEALLEAWKALNADRSVGQVLVPTD
jgi:putative transcriptional regulator